MIRHAWAAAALAAAAVAGNMAVAAAQATTIATWVQYAPGSSSQALIAGTWGDQPTNPIPTILVRAVVTDATACPAAFLDRITPLTLHQRFVGGALTSTPGSAGAANGKAGYPQYFVSATATSPGTFPNGNPMATTSWGECEAVVPVGHTIVSVDGMQMKLPSQQPRRILVMADTGCRMNGGLAADGGNQQNCSDPVAFPWSTLANYEATFNPDVVLQIGDWFYRDTNCLTGGAETFPGCNTPSSANYEVWGDTFDSWNADVFFPAKNLLAAAPWIMVRGNHESCGRGARGWYALLDPYPYNYNSVVCRKTAAYPAPSGGSATYTGDFEPSYLVNLGGVDVMVHDSSFANDSAVDANTAANYDIDLSRLLAAARAVNPGGYEIFVTHKPTFGLSYGSPPNGCVAGAQGLADDSGDWTEQSVFNGGSSYAASAFAGGVPPEVAVFLSGHVHQFQYINTGSGPTLNRHFAPQLIVGVGGTLLDDDCNTGKVPQGNLDVAPFGQLNYPYEVQRTGGTFSSVLSDSYAHDEFGFALLTATPDPGTGAITGYHAAIYTVQMTQAGNCRINFNPRRIACSLQ